MTASPALVKFYANSCKLEVSYKKIKYENINIFIIFTFNYGNNLDQAECYSLVKVNYSLYFKLNTAPL
jgi:hypothetical protein